MIDPIVAYDKLAQFETEDEIAEFLYEVGIKGRRALANSCAISEYMAQMTGRKFSTCNTIETIEEPIKTFRLTSAIDDFITSFDDNKYPELVDPEGW